MLIVLRDRKLVRLSGTHWANPAGSLIMQGNLRRIFQTELFQGLIQHLNLLDRQVSVHLDYDSPYPNSGRHLQFGQL